jgi:hypothetical protein
MWRGGGRRCSLAPLVATFAIGLGACGEPAASHAEAQARVQQWMTDRAAGWTLEIDDANAAHGFARVGDATACPSTELDLEYRAGSYDVGLAFPCPSPAIATLAELQDAVKGAGVSDVPPAISLQGWKFRAFSQDGVPAANVHFLSWQSGRVEVELDNVPIFLSASQTADACSVSHEPVSADCYVPALQAVPLTLKIKAALPSDAF